MNNKTPYENLNPDLILTAIESVGFICNGSLIALNSYENRVYQIGIEDADPIIAKFYRPGRWTDAAILEEHAFAQELLDHEIPIVAPIISQDGTLHKFENFRFALFPRRGGRPLELDNLDHLEWMGRFIGRMHAVSATKPFEHRMTINVTTYGYDPYQFLKENNFIPETIHHNYCLAVDGILQSIEQVYEALPPLHYIRLHGDCHAGNVLWNNGPLFVDLDDCLQGPAIQDLWMLTSGQAAHEVKLQLDRILDGYEEFFEFNYYELKLIEVLRTLRMLHYSAWLARRWDDPAFPLNFPWFNTPRYWDEQLQQLRDQENKLESLIEGM